MDTRRRLYHARISSRLTLEQIGMRTALSPSVLRHIDEGKFELLPSGLYARSYVRTFASAVGLDPEAALADVGHLLPGAPDPLPALNAARPDPAEWASHLVQRALGAVAALVVTAVRRVNAEVRAVAPHWRTARDRAHAWATPQVAAALRRIEPRTSSRDLTTRLQPWVSACRTRVEAATGRVHALISNDLSARLVERIAALNTGFEAWHYDSLRGRLASIERLQTSRRFTRCSAAVIDALLLLVVDSFLVLLVSWSSGIPVNRLLTEAGWAVGALCAIPITLYFVLFGGIAGSTLGRYLCGLLTLPDHHTGGSARPDHPLTLPEILRRAVKQ